MNPDPFFDVEAYYSDALSDRFVDADEFDDLSLEELASQPDAKTLRDGAMDEIVALHSRARLLVADEYRATAEVLWGAADDPRRGPDPIPPEIPPGSIRAIARWPRCGASESTSRCVRPQRISQFGCGCRSRRCGRGPTT